MRALFLKGRVATGVAVPIVVSGLLAIHATHGGLEAQSDVSFETFFVDKTMRVDYFHSGGLGTGDAGSRSDRGPWAGSRTRLIDDLVGSAIDHFEQILAKIEGRVLTGVCLYLRRVETTPESRERHRTFHESLRFPWPRSPVQVVLKVRDAENSFHEIWSTVIDPDSRFVNPADRAPAGDVWPIIESGPPSEKVDLW